MTTILVAGPADMALTRATTKAYLKVPSSETAEDSLIDLMIKAAIKNAEAETDRRFYTQTWDYTRRDWPQGCDQFELPFPPVQSITSVKYRDAAGAEHTWSSDEYQLVKDGAVHVIRLKPGYSWPTDLDVDQPVPITVRVVVGYGATEASMPEDILLALLFMVGHYYENRQLFVTGTIVQEVPEAAHTLLGNYRVRANLP